MHTVWVRLNAVVFFGLTVLLGLSVLAAVSKIGHERRHRPDIRVLALNQMKSLKNHGGVDRALLSFDLHVSFVPAFFPPPAPGGDDGDVPRAGGGGGGSVPISLSPVALFFTLAPADA